MSPETNLIFNLILVAVALVNCFTVRNIYLSFAIIGLSLWSIFR